MNKIENLFRILSKKINNIEPEYKVYVALISDNNTQNPTVIILENTIGEIVWTRPLTGLYRGTLNNAFTSNKVFISVVQGSSTSHLSGHSPDSSAVLIGSMAPYVNEFDNSVLNASIEIRIYK